MTAAVIVSIRVGATPLRAFEAFTEDIGEWWRPNPMFALTPRGDGHLRFEAGEGGGSSRRWRTEKSSRSEIGRAHV